MIEPEEFPVATFCGSMRNYSLMLEMASAFTTAGVICILPHAVIAQKDQGEPLKEMLDDMHRTKIFMADFIVKVGEYTGESTRRELEYALSLGLRVITAITPSQALRDWAS